MNPIRFTLAGRKGGSIASLNDWRAHAAPKSEGQWQPGRSAMESLLADVGLRDDYARGTLRGHPVNTQLEEVQKRCGEQTEAL